MAVVPLTGIRGCAWGWVAMHARACILPPGAATNPVDCAFEHACRCAVRCFQASPLDPSAPEYFPTAGPRSSCDAPSTMRTPSPRGSPMGARKEQCAFDDVGSDFLAQQLATAQEQIAQLTIANKVLREQTGGPGVPQAQVGWRQGLALRCCTTGVLAFPTFVCL